MHSYGYTNPLAAAAAGSRLLRNVKVRNSLQASLRERGINEDSIAIALKNLRDSRNAMAKVKYVELSSSFLGYR